MQSPPPPPPARSDRRLLAVLAAIALPYYLFLMAKGADSLFMPTRFGLTFNSMLAHLLRGALDVDPAAIGAEGFLRDGRVYPYFGIVPALLRLPLLPFVDLARTDVTGLMCALAAWLAACCKFAAILRAGRALPPSPLGRIATLALIAATLFGGAQVPFLYPSLYQEAALFAGAFAALFVCLAIHGLLGARGFTPALLAAMALAAVLALLTRVSTGLGLCLALVLLLAMLRPPRGLLVCLTFLALGIGAVLAINAARWGDPFVFVPHHLQAMTDLYAGRREILARYGDFHPIRLGYGLMYYFAPAWIIVGEDGRFLFEAFRSRTIISVELPPGSLLLSEPLLFLLTIFFLVELRRSWPRDRLALPLIVGLAIPAALMLVAPSMTFRYRLEFYPALELAALLGLRTLGLRAAATPAAASLRPVLLACCLLGILVGQTTYLLHRASEIGDAAQLLELGRLGAGPLAFYRPVLPF